MATQPKQSMQPQLLKKAKLNRERVPSVQGQLEASTPPIKKKTVRKVTNMADKELMNLPATGLDWPFLRKRPIFIKDAPSFEPIYYKPRFG